MHLFTLFLFLTLAAPKVFAWGPIAHGAVAEIAERNLTLKAQDFVRSILGPEPMAVAANWPDQIKSDRRFDALRPYHFIEIPYRYKDLEEYHKDHAGHQSAHIIISQAKAILTNKKISREEKMIMLRMLIHVVGDVHMPLHIGSGEDRGGNLCNVKWPDPLSENLPKKLNLHWVWDDALIDHEAKKFKTETQTGKINHQLWFGYKEYADLIVVDESRFKEYLSFSGNPNDWYKESREIHAKVYPDTKPTLPANRVYCKWIDPRTKKVLNGAYNERKLPTLTLKYIDQSTKIIRERVYQAGIRLANSLNDIAESSEKASAPSIQDMLDGVLKKLSAKE
jgi:hypothetical protein